MPKKRNTSWSRNKKEKQILTARLIEISMKVEDHIYKHKPISVCDAEQYMREVSSYKTRCSQDERSLQVIEKLTRCMKAIITDHQYLKTDNQTINNGSSAAVDARAGSVSPVYSIPDEDRTQFTQIDEVDPVNVTDVNEDVEIIDLSSTDVEDLTHNGTDTTPVKNTNSKIAVEVEIHRSMSCLSLKDVGDQLETTSSEVNCSQSILKHFEVIDGPQQNHINEPSQEAVGVKLVGKAVDKEKNVVGVGEKNYNTNDNNMTGLVFKPPKKINTDFATNSAANLIINMKYDTIPKPVQVVDIAKCDLTVSYKNVNIEASSVYPSSNIPESQRQASYDLNRTCTINKSAHTLKANSTTHMPDILVKNATNSNMITTNTFDKVENSKQSNNLNETSREPKNTTIVKDNSTKKKRGPRKKKVVDDNEAKPKNKTVNTTLKNKELVKNKNVPVPIYNENVINDLSWVENIRFVREIRNDENDSKLHFDDTFWNNYYLPAGWSDNEFL